MALSPGQTLSFYEIVGPLGAGGMGEVYRARDTRLEREVAIKVLPEDLADDAERLMRFEREAKTLASLNHPNVAGIHGVDQADGIYFLALELVPGEDLATRLGRGALPLDEAIDVCRQIAEGLEAAHEAGVIHRDLKPANVRVTPDGLVKVLDFGLAKPIVTKTTAAGTSSAESDSFLLTEEGRVLGTPTYMSPEQARGKPVDRRTDIWAFGCVLYECLTGKRAFEGGAYGELVAAILHDEVDLDALPAATPAHVRRLIVHALVKDPRRRLRDIGEARVTLEGGRAGAEPGATTAAARSGVGRGLLAGAVLGAVSAVVGLLAFGPSDAARAPSQPTHLTVRLTDSRINSFRGSALAYSPSGDTIAFAARDPEAPRDAAVRKKLYVVDLRTGATRGLEGTAEADCLFFAPAGDWVGFFARGKLWKIALVGGAPVPICDAPDVRGASWGDDDHIVFGSTEEGRLMRVSAAGGEPVPLTTLEQGDFYHTHPQVLPGSDSIVYVLLPEDVTHNDARIEVYSRSTGETRLIHAGGSGPRWVATGHLTFVRDGTLFAAPFDLERLELRGTPVPIAEGMQWATGSGAASYSFAADGSLVCVPVSDAIQRRTLAWLARDGLPEPVPVPPRSYTEVRLSPDGSRLAIVFDATLGLCDLTRGTVELLLDADMLGWSPVWNRTGDWLNFVGTSRSQTWETSRPYRMRPDGIGQPELIVDKTQVLGIQSASPQGGVLTLLILKHFAGTQRAWFFEPGKDPALRLCFDEDEKVWRARFSDDGNHLAYVSHKSDAAGQVFVSPYPALDSRVRVSPDNGADVQWWPGRSVLTYSNDYGTFAVDYRIEDDRFAVGEPRLLVPRELPDGSTVVGYDLEPDGTSVLAILEPPGIRPGHVSLVLNALADLGGD